MLPNNYLMAQMVSGRSAIHQAPVLPRTGVYSSLRRLRSAPSIIGAAPAIITGHARWIELAWLSIAASLLAIVVSGLWPMDKSPKR